MDPKLFALVIGINDYPEIKKLNGAVKDAQSISVYLRVDLDIPANHITEIYNEKATRAAIVNGFRTLQNDSRIARDDAIFIFYAGHGCEVDSPEGWENNGKKIQGLVPYDVKTLDSTGRVVEILPDHTIASLLDDLADVKGDNIVSILVGFGSQGILTSPLLCVDCCI
jgi:uncharacterized caspase-like protein